MRTSLSLALSLILSVPALAAFNATMQWDVRTTGSNSNGGGYDPGVASPGTNFAQQDAAQVAYTDIVIGATTTQGTSVATPFSSTSPGNVVNITAGAGCTVQRAEILSVSGATATFDKTLGTAASTCTGNLGGGLLTIATANGLMVSGNTVNIKSGTYTQTVETTIPVAISAWIGYGTTWADGGTKPLITTATNSTPLINTGVSNAGRSVFTNLSLSNTAVTRASGIRELSAHGTTQFWEFNTVIFDGFTDCIDSSNGAPDDVAYIIVNKTEVKNCTTAGLRAQSSSTTSYIWIGGSYFHGNVVDVWTGTAGSFLSYSSIFAGSSSEALTLNAPYSTIINTVVASSSGAAINCLGGSTILLTLQNSILYGNSYGVKSTSSGNNAIASALASRNNAFGSNTNGNTNWNGSVGDVTLSANPFTNSASGDYSLNSTAGGGAALKALGFPGVFPGGLSTGYPDIGAVQSQGSSGSGSAASGFVF